MALTFALLIEAVLESFSLDTRLYNYLIEHWELDNLVRFLAKLTSMFALDLVAIVALLLTGGYWLIDRYFWKIWPVRNFLDIPDLSGKWIGTIDREEFPSNKKETGVPISISIRQRFSTMSFCLENPVATSMSNTTRSMARILGISGSRDSGYMLRDGFDFKDKGGQLIFGTTIWEVSEDDKGRFMEGEYVSGFPRKGHLNVRHLCPGECCLQGEIRRLKDDAGREYLGVVVPIKKINPFLKKLKRKFGGRKYLTLTRNRSKRDGPEHHITVVTPPELAELDKQAVAGFMSDGTQQPSAEFVLQSIGRARTSESETYYIAVYSPHLAFLRQRAGLPPKDFHVTLGFDPHDIYGSDRIPEDDFIRP